jgi:hypothetical protein
MEDAEIKKPMSLINKIINIFVSPREAFEAINEKPTWFVPFIIIIVFVLFMMFMTMDVQLNDQLKVLQSRDMTEQQMEAAQSGMQGPLRYIGFVAAPIGMLIVNLIIAGLLLLASNLMISGNEVTYKKIFSLIMWSGLVGIINVLITTFLAMQKGTMVGVSMDLSILLPTVPIGESKTWLHYLLARFDLFVFWQMILWVIGLSVMYKTTIKKAMTPVLTLWIIWVVIAVGLGSTLGKFIPGM